MRVMHCRCFTMPACFFHCPTSIANMWCFSPGRWQARWALTFHKLGAWWTFQLFGIFPDWCVRVVAAILLIGLARLLWGVLKGPFFPRLFTAGFHPLIVWQRCQQRCSCICDCSALRIESWIQWLPSARDHASPLDVEDIASFGNGTRSVSGRTQQTLAKTQSQS